ncbi:MAG: hypothetical protein KatS3mg121_0427 [Gammaproteobacteria bacterium]|nr:MAG: hypothetical protein KatS3mg121_0427 [Gammaproteobacteria bacterium]
MDGTRDTPTTPLDEEPALNDLDVTQAVRVSDPQAVKVEVLSIHEQCFPGHPADDLARAFELFTRAYRGQLPGYHACDTFYHDVQHCLDITLAAARLLRGYQKAHGDLERERFVLGVVTALFHDVGYLRRRDEPVRNGAEYTAVHVTRGAEFMRRELPALGLGALAERAARIVHYTGYELPLTRIEPLEPGDRLIGELVASADLMAQMADRCYLEKCRDRLFPELVLAGHHAWPMGAPLPSFTSPRDLLLNTPQFYHRHVRRRLERELGGAFRYAESYFNGRNPYLDGMRDNIRYLEHLIRSGDLNPLRRRLPPLGSAAARALQAQLEARAERREQAEPSGRRRRRRRAG